MENYLTLSAATAFDALTVLGCFVIALRQAKGFLLHPAWMLLGVHAYIVSFRLAQLNAGSRPLGARFAWPIALEEIIRASLACDLGLIAIATGWVLGRYLVKREQSQGKLIYVMAGGASTRTTIVAVIGLAVGLTMLLQHRHAQAVAVDQSGYANAAQTWPGFCLCLLHFLYGFPPLLCLGTGLTLTFVLFFNERFAVVIPLIFLVYLWLSRRRRTGIPIIVFPAAVLVILLWLPMKPFVKEMARGSEFATSVRAAIQATADSFNSSESSIDTQFLDMIAGTMTLSDVHGSQFWGGTIAPLFVSPIPRSIWPEKPRLNQFQFDIDLPTRSIAHEGMTPGLVGEGYADFGYFGVFLECFVVSLVYTVGFWKTAGPFQTRTSSFLLYLIFLASIMQVYRDGLSSAIWFPFVYAAPLACTALAETIVVHFRRAQYLRQHFPELSRRRRGDRGALQLADSETI